MGPILSHTPHQGPVCTLTPYTTMPYGALVDILMTLTDMIPIHDISSLTRSTLDPLASPCYRHTVIPAALPRDPSKWTRDTPYQPGPSWILW